MHKKIFTALILIVLQGQINVNAAQIKGYNNVIKDRLNIMAINPLQATADNDGVTVSSNWPKDFDNNVQNILSYIYLMRNNENTLEVIKFDYITPKNNCEISSESLCLPHVKPSITSFEYGNRFYINNTPDFINNPENSERYEILIQDKKFFDTKYEKKLNDIETPSIKKNCILGSNNNETVCSVLDSDNDEILYTEKLTKRTSPNLKSPEFFKYTKYYLSGKKAEEYNYTSGKHTFYNENGDIQEFYQWNKNKFRYYNKNMPDLYIDTNFIYDSDDNLVEELLYDNNQKLIRKYGAQYSPDGELKGILVSDYVNGENWTILPIKSNNLSDYPFDIRM